jgi:phage shock protein E
MPRKLEIARRLMVRGAALAAAAALLAACGSSPRPGVAPISADELAQKIAADDAPLILDVRTEREYEAGHIPGAVNIPYDQLAGRLGELPASHSDELVVHCESGRRASVAEGVLVDAGYTDVRDLDGHMKGWRASGLPTE